MNVNSNVPIDSGSYYISSNSDPKKQELLDKITNTDNQIAGKENELFQVEELRRRGGDSKELLEKKAKLESEIHQLKGERLELIKDYGVENYINDVLDPKIKALQDKIAYFQAKADSASDSDYSPTKKFYEDQIAKTRRSLEVIEYEKASLQNSSTEPQSAVTSDSELTKAMENEQVRDSTRSSLRRLRTPGIRI